MKNQLRKTILNLRSKLTVDEVAAKSASIAQNLQGIQEYQQAEVVMFYVDFRNEVQTGKMIQAALAQGKRVVVPITDRQNIKLIPSEIKAYPADLAPGTWGILEPKSECVRPVPVTEIDLVIVPGVGFDEQGNRLGYGGGFYDRFTITLRPEVKLVALAFELQLREQVFPEAHDNPVDYVITENRIIACR